MITTAITNDRFTWCLRVERKFTIFALFSDSKQVILAGTASLIPIVIPLPEQSSRFGNFGCEFVPPEPNSEPV